MPKRLAFRMITFDWMIPVDHRHKVEEVLASLGYDVDGGGTNIESRTAEIFIRPQARSHKRKEVAADE